MLRINVYNRLRDDILNQIYQAGESLTESRITQDLGVSRTPVREAFAQLQKDGLVDSIPNKGVIVRGLSLLDIQDMYDMRACIEGIAAKRACEEMTEENLVLLQDALKKEEICTQEKDYHGFQTSDFDFHNAIIKSSNSRIFENLLISMLQYTRIARTRSLSSGSRAKQVLEEHDAIYDAIKKRDPALAKKRMELHVINAKESFTKTLIEREN